MEDKRSLDSLFDSKPISPTEQSTEFSMENWFDSSVTPDTVTVQDFDKYVEEYLVQRKIADEIEAQLTQENKKLMAMSGKLIEFLDIMGKTKHVVASGTIQKVEMSQYRPPEGEARENVIQALKDSGDYDNVTAFNAGKFSSWYKAALEADPNFQLEGVEQKVSRYIKFNRMKG